MDKILEFSNAHPVLVLLLTVSFLLLVFTELRRKAAGLVAVEPADAVALINNDGVVLDLRSAESFARGHIVNARNIPFDEFDAGSSKIAKFKDTPLVAVCDSGTTSTKVVDALRKAGFGSSYGLKGGMAAWGEAGLPVVGGKKTKSKA
jgi:rhodanese-related sulfurtransferase